MKVAITGSSGLLGRAVVKKFKEQGHDVTALAFSRATEGFVKLNLEDYSAVDEFFQTSKPDVVIHCAAERRPDVAEKDPEATQRLNVAVTSHLAELSVKLGFFIVYISTDYVFPGDAPAGTGYEPTDKVEPLNLYGRTKEEGEREVLKVTGESKNGVVLRVPVLYGLTEKNSESAINILLDVVRDSSKQTKMDDWATRYPTNVEDIGRVLVDVSSLYTSSKGKTLPPILHFSSTTVFTKYSICQTFASLHSPPLSTDHLIPVREGPKEGETKRPRDCHLSNKVLEQELGIDCSNIDFQSWWKNHVLEV